MTFVTPCDAERVKYLVLMYQILYSNIRFCFQNETAYLSSSILASFLDTATLAYRVRNEPMPLRYITDYLTLPGRQVRLFYFFKIFHEIG